MQTAPATIPRTAAAAATRPGTVIGHGDIRGWDAARQERVAFTADVLAGPVLRSGITDIHQAAMDLIARGWKGQREHTGLVGFVRAGDAWDAVALLAPALPGAPLKQLWSVSELQGLRLAPGVQLDAIWQISDYGGDMRWRTPQSMIPELG